MTKILGIRGSPREGGNSDLLLERLFEGARIEGAEVEGLRVADLDLSGCRECNECRQTGECVVHDDMDLVLGKLDAADSVVLATPVFFYGVPAQLKILIDRCQARWWKRKRIRTTKGHRSHSSGCGFLVAVGGSGRENTFQGVELTVREFFRTLDRDYGGSVLSRQVEDKGSIQKRAAALKAAFALGQQAAGSQSPGCRPAEPVVRRR